MVLQYCPAATVLACNDTRRVYNESLILPYSKFQLCDCNAIFSDSCTLVAGCRTVVESVVCRQLVFVECLNFRSSLCRLTMISPMNS
jgi:hypothetical protein